MWGIGETTLAFTAVTIYFLRPSIFEFDRTTNEFRCFRPSPFRSHSGHIALDKIGRVRDDGGTKAYDVLMETPGATSDASHHHQIVDLIRTWFAR